MNSQQAAVVNSTTTVRDIMSEGVQTISARDTLRKAAKAMEQFGCGALPVLDNGTLLGIVTDRDMVVFGVAADLNVEETTVRDIMTTNVVTCNSTATLEEAADIMSDQDVRRLVVLDEKDHVTGVLSIIDMIRSACVEGRFDDELLHHLFRYT